MLRCFSTSRSGSWPVQSFGRRTETRQSNRVEANDTNINLALFRTAARLWFLRARKGTTSVGICHPRHSTMRNSRRTDQSPFHLIKRQTAHGDKFRIEPRRSRRAKRSPANGLCQFACNGASTMQSVGAAPFDMGFGPLVLMCVRTPGVGCHAC
jgi:hypothetical protein